MMQMKMTHTMTMQMTMSLPFQCKLRIRLHNAWCLSIAESFTFVNMCLLISNICSAVGSQRGPILHYSLSSVWALAGARVGPVVDQTWTQLYTGAQYGSVIWSVHVKAWALLEPIMGPIDQPQCGFTWASCRAYIGPRHMDIFNYKL